MAEGGYDPHGPEELHYEGAGPIMDHDEIWDRMVYLMPGDDALKRVSRRLPSARPGPDQPAGSSSSTQSVDDFIFKADLRWADLDVIKNLNTFNSDTTKYLDNLQDAVYNHREVSQHIRHFVVQEVQMDPVSFHPENRDHLRDDLSYLTFTEEMAGKLVQWIPDSILTSQNAAYWATNFLENWIFCSQDGPYMCMNSCIDVWFDREFKASDGSIRNIRIFNENGNVQQNSEFWDDGVGEFQFFFHGTDWDSVNSIVRNGVLLSGGVFGKDFSCKHRPGFYVSENVESSKVWAKAKAACPAVIVFRVPRGIFDVESNHLNLSTRNSDFQKKVYLYHRSNMEETVDLELETELQGYKTITGPLLINPAELHSTPNAEPILSRDLQLCIRDKQIASQFHDFIHGVVYYEKQELKPPGVE